MSVDGIERPLSASGKWADSPPPPDFVMENFDEHQSLAEAQAELDRLLPGERQPHLDDAIFDDPKYDTEVLWIKRTYHVGEAAVRQAILKAFDDSGLENVEIVMLYVSTSEEHDRAYVVMNSLQATDMLLDGTVSAVVRIPIEPEFLPKEDEDGNDEQGRPGTDEFRDVTLWMDIADHLVAKEHQDPYTLYLWQLPTQIPATEVEAQLRKVIQPLSPIYRLEVKQNADGRCGSWAKVGFKYESHTRKCIYMLNFNYFLGNEIRAAFFHTSAKSKQVVNPKGAVRPRQSDRKQIPRPPSATDKSKKKNEKPRRPSDQKSPSANRKPLPAIRPKKLVAKKEKLPTKKPAVNKIAEGADGWTIVGREGRK